MDYKQAPTKTIGESYTVIDNALIFDQTLFQHKFLGARELAAMLAGTFDIGEKGEIIISGGASKLQYNDGTGNSPSVIGGVKYIHYGDDGKVYAEIQQTGVSTQFGVGYTGNIPSISGATWTLSAAQINGVNGFKNQVLGVNITIPLEDGAKNTPYSRPNRTDIGDVGTNLRSYAQ